MMNSKRRVNQLTRGLLVLTALTAIAFAPIMASADQATIRTLSKQVKQYQGEVQRLKQDHEFTQYKLASTQEKLRQSERELLRKKNQLNKMQTHRETANISEDAIANEKKRLEVLELGITSQRAALERLEEKEQELAEQISSNEKRYASTKQKLARHEQAYQDRLEREIRQLTEQVHSLQQQNQQLELAVEEELVRAESAKAEARMLAEKNAALVEDASQDEQLQTTEDSAVAQNGSNKTDMTQMVLPGELPIYQEENDSDIVLRSRTLDEQYNMREISQNIYEAEVTIKPGTDRAYFDVIRRRYRGRFPDTQESVTYIFTLNRTDPEKPVMDIRQKEADQVVSNSDAPL